MSANRPQPIRFTPEERAMIQEIQDRSVNEKPSISLIVRLCVRVAAPRILSGKVPIYVFNAKRRVRLAPAPESAHAQIEEPAPTAIPEAAVVPPSIPEVAPDCAPASPPDSPTTTV